LGSINKISKSNFILKVAKKLKVKLNYKKIDFKIIQKLKTKRPLNMSMNVNKFQKEFSMKLPSIQSQINKLTIK
jgi:dTDP-4-dehydrorhamnose reductase